jgi:hypothetical protein
MDHRALVTIVVALSLVRCGDDTPVPEEDLGTALTEQNQVRPDEIESALAWSASGREVAYLRSPLFAPDRPQVRAVQVESGVTRTIDASDRTYRRIVRGGEWLYIETFVGEQATLERRPFAGGDVTVLATNVSQFNHAFAVSDDGATVVYCVGRTLYATTGSPGAPRALGVGRPLAFSPDGAQVLVTHTPPQSVLANGGFSTVRVSDGVTAALPVPPANLGEVKNARWDDRGPRAITYDDPTRGLFILDLATGASVRAATTSESPDAVAFNARGDGAIYATGRCVDSSGFRCTNTEYVLRLAVPGAPERTIARGYTGTGAGLVGFGVPAISPAGDRIAFVFNTNLYVKPL